MARTHRSSSASEDHEPKYFAKHGYAYEDPNKVKKNGAGRRNWGSEMDDVADLETSGQFNFNHSRRMSNSSSQRTAGGSISSVSDSDVFDEE